MSQLIDRLTKETQDLIATCEKIDEHEFFDKFQHKWSAAENVQHLILSVEPLANVISGPREVLDKWHQPPRASRPYETIVFIYQDALRNPPPPIPRYQPQLEKDVRKEALLQNFYACYKALAQQLESWTEEEMKTYFLPHPLIGMLTVEEISLFTAYHISHHKRAIIWLREQLKVSGH